jgi:hypothetical protein
MDEKSVMITKSINTVVIVFTKSWIAMSWVNVVAIMPEPTTLAARSKEPRNSAVNFLNIFILHMWT